MHIGTRADLVDPVRRFGSGPASQLHGRRDPLSPSQAEPFDHPQALGPKLGQSGCRTAAGGQKPDRELFVFDQQRKQFGVGERTGPARLEFVYDIFQG